MLMFVVGNPLNLKKSMAGRTGAPRDCMDEWLSHAAAEGRSSMMPERAFPGMVLGYTICAGAVSS